MIQSHQYPFKSLKQHIEEVEQAAKAILGCHSTAVNHLIADSLDYVINFHDLGKASPEFQKYIDNPKQYRKGKRFKAHAPVSLILWLLYAQEKKIPEKIILPVVAAVWKHHGDFPTLNDILYESESVYDYEEDYEVSAYPARQISSELNMDIIPPIQADEFDIQDLFDDMFFDTWTIEEAAEYKVKGLLLFSILLEADRTFLALSSDYLGKKLRPRPSPNIPLDIVDSYLSQKVMNKKQNAELNQQRTALRYAIINNSGIEPNTESVSLPTGLGKTLTAAQWALKNRIRSGIKRKVIIILPYLSIIDQTVKEYKRLFNAYEAEALILEAHSIAERKYIDDSFEDQSSKHNDAIDFFADTWSADFVITTFDQFLYTLLSSKSTYLLRFHNLADALIIIDEIQALPSTLWEPISMALNALSSAINTKTLIMSATQPGFLQTRELVPAPDEIFKKQNRYGLVLKHHASMKLDSFTDDCLRRIEEENWHSKRVMIVLNTRKSARAVLDALENKIDCDTFFLSADVTPKERLENIFEIQKNNPCLVITTQCIEAGVDIDMDIAIRDLAPLDSIVQCAGRCNRNGLKERAGVEIVSLTTQNGAKYSELVYDKTLLEKTLMIFYEKNEDIYEEDIFHVINDYFQKIRLAMDTGRQTAKKWAFWEDDLNIRSLLRDEQRKYNFIVLSQDEPDDNEKPLRSAILSALESDSVWERKRNIKALQNRIAELTISVWEIGEIVPEEIAEPVGCYYLLKDDFYIPGKGFSIEENWSSSEFF